jgi:hypothetical protein
MTLHEDIGSNGTMMLSVLLEMTMAANGAPGREGISESGVSNQALPGEVKPLRRANGAIEWGPCASLPPNARRCASNFGTLMSPIVVASSRGFPPATRAALP